MDLVQAVTLALAVASARETLCTWRTSVVCSCSCSVSLWATPKSFSMVMAVVNEGRLQRVEMGGAVSGECALEKQNLGDWRA